MLCFPISEIFAESDPLKTKKGILTLNSADTIEKRIDFSG